MITIGILTPVFQVLHWVRERARQHREEARFAVQRQSDTVDGGTAPHGRAKNKGSSDCTPLDGGGQQAKSSRHPEPSSSSLSCLIDREACACVSLAAGSATESDVTVADFLGELYARAGAHFALEEKIMRDYDYDEYRDHEADHERLLDDVRDLMDDYEDGVYVDVEGFGQRLDEWFSEHFRTRDARLHKKIFRARVQDPHGTYPVLRKHD